MASTTGEHKSRCPVLEGTQNFPIWKIRIIAYLRREKVVGYTLGTIPRPTTTTIVPQIYAPATSEASWDEADAKAHGILIDHISDRLALKVSTLPTSKQVLDEIIRIHESTNAGVRAFFALVDLVGSHWDGQSSVEEHIGKIRTASGTLDAMGRPVGDEFLAFLLLYSLPQDDPNWDTFRTSILNSIPAVPIPSTSASPGAPVPVTPFLSFDTVEARLTAQVNSMRRSANTSAGDSALKASAPTRSSAPRTSSSLSTSRGTKHCSLHGTNSSHTLDECRKLKEQKKDKPKDGKGRSTHANSVAEDTEDDESDGGTQSHYVTIGKRVAQNIRAYSARASTSDQPACIADTGATSHIVPYSDWFDPSTYRTLTTPRRIHFGDESYVEATGVGNVHLKCQVGESTHEITLRNVLYAPSFKLALISVHRICERRIRARFSDKLCKIIRDGQTIMTGYHRRNLYHLRVSPVVHLPPPELVNAAIDINVLHRRMGHHNFQSLQRMVRKGQLENIDKLTGEPEFCEPCAGAKM
jgi:hypothetical protein